MIWYSGTCGPEWYLRLWEGSSMDMTSGKYQYKQKEKLDHIHAMQMSPLVGSFTDNIGSEG